MSTITLAPVRPAARPARPAARTAVRPGGSVRLTRRGRVVVFLLALAVVAAVAVSLAAGSAATREEGVAPAIEVVTVAPGDTLWDIASDVAAVTGGDVRGAMAKIEELNALDGSLVYAGQQLRVPAAD
ncbi:MAG TPA: LysM peptidoglycan-binding domain-containing protein [Nocardioides sp.]|nr:LysM peptidoglycan-binding domain-containing protein [Nocardioides sp.]